MFVETVVDFFFLPAHIIQIYQSIITKFINPFKCFLFSFCSVMEEITEKSYTKLINYPIATH